MTRRSAADSDPTSPGSTNTPAPVAATSPKPPTSLSTTGLANASAVASTPDWSKRSVREYGSTTTSARRK